MFPNVVKNGQDKPEPSRKFKLQSWTVSFNSSSVISLHGRTGRDKQTRPRSFLAHLITVVRSYAKVYTRLLLFQVVERLIVILGNRTAPAAVVSRNCRLSFCEM